MAAKPDWAMAGTMPGDHGLDKIRKAVLDDPRQRWFGVVEFTFRHAHLGRPEDGDDERTEVATIVALDPVTDVAEIDQLRAIQAKARSQRPGQTQLGDPGENDPASAAS